MTEFADLKKLYDENDFQAILEHPRGREFLKIRSISRTELLKKLAKMITIDISNVEGRQLFEFMFNKKIDENNIEEFIKKTYITERNERKKNEDTIYSQLYKLKTFDWGGLYSGSLETTIVDNYIKKIQDFTLLEEKIDNEIHSSMRGYVLNSWYNHWSSILIEDIFKDHKNILPTIGLIKKIDFFWDDFPFDLKVTYFPEGFMAEKRRELELRPQLTELKIFARENSIQFDKNNKDKEIFEEIFNKIKESKAIKTKEFLKKFVNTRKNIIEETAKNPKELLIWLYEKQGERRFDASNRLFLILVNLNELEESWKLKSNKDILNNKINTFLDNGISNKDDLKLEFCWKGEKFVTYSTVIFVFV